MLILGKVEIQSSYLVTLAMIYVFVCLLIITIYICISTFENISHSSVGRAFISMVKGPWFKSRMTVGTVPLSALIERHQMVHCEWAYDDECPLFLSSGI